jgi:hypothetical protein
MKAGVGKLDITPHGAVWMDGMIRAHRSTGVHDPLFARALALTSGESPDDVFVIVAVDLCTLHAEASLKVREQASRRTGVPVSHIVIAATHTHSGPATFGYFNPKEHAYVAELSGKLAEVIEQAVRNMVPAAAGCASGREDTISHYRRLLADDGHVVMNWEPFPPERIVGPLGEIDPEVGVLKVVHANQPDKVMAILFNHAGHPNVMSGDNYLISADYPGLACRLVEADCGGMAVFVNGAQGTMDIDGLRDRDWSGMERVGKALAAAVSATAKTVKLSASAQIRGVWVSYDIPARRVSDTELAWAEEILKKTGGAIQPVADGVGDDYKAGLLKRLRERQDRPIPAEQICLAVDGSAFVSVPGELFTEIGVRIKRGSPFRQTYIVGLANGCIGYIPTRKAIGQGGYESETRELDDAAEDIIMAQSLALLERVHGLRG